MSMYQFIQTKSIKLYQFWHMYICIGSLEKYTPLDVFELGIYLKWNDPKNYLKQVKYEKYW